MSFRVWTVTIIMELFNKIRNGQIYIIAEMSANHAGKLENALKIVRQSGLFDIEIHHYGIKGGS